MNKKLSLTLMIGMLLILLDLILSILLKNSYPLPITDMDWINAARQSPYLLLYHLDGLNLIIAWVFAVFFYQLKNTNARFNPLFVFYGVGLLYMTIMNRAFLVWGLAQFTVFEDSNILALIHQGRHDAWWTLPGFLIQNLSFLYLAYTFIQNKTTRLLGILGCLGFSLLSIYLILIRFLSINPMMMGMAAIGGIIALVFYGSLIKHLQNHSL